MIGYGAYRLATEPEFPTRLLGEFCASPRQTITALLGVACTIIFFWGLIIRPFGNIPVDIGPVHLNLVTVGGIGALGWFVYHSLSKD